MGEIPQSEDFYNAVVARSWRAVELAWESSGETPLTDVEKRDIELGIAAGITSTFGELQELGLIGQEGDTDG